MAFQLTEALDNLYTTTWQNMKDEAKDNVFQATPFWFWMKDKGRLQEVPGGRWIAEPLEYFQNDQVFWVTKGGTVPLNDIEFLTIARYDWRYLVGNIVRFGVDDQQNRGKNAIMSLLNAKLNNIQKALVETLETSLAGGSGVATNSMDGVQFIVPNDPTSAANNAGGVDPSVNTWWRNQFTNMTGQSFATFGVSNMRTLYNNCMNNYSMDAPDIIVSSQGVYEFYEDNVLSYYRTYNKKLGDLGFDAIQFKGMPMVWTPAMTQIMYMLNTNFFKFIYDPAMFFEMTEWKPIPDQINDRAAQIVTACQLTVSRRRCQGVMFNINTP